MNTKKSPLFALVALICFSQMLFVLSQAGCLPGLSDCFGLSRKHNHDHKPKPLKPYVIATSKNSSNMSRSLEVAACLVILDGQFGSSSLSMPMKKFVDDIWSAVQKSGHKKSLLAVVQPDSDEFRQWSRGVERPDECDQLGATMKTTLDAHRCFNQVRSSDRDFMSLLQRRISKVPQVDTFIGAAFACYNSLLK